MSRLSNKTAKRLTMAFQGFTLLEVLIALFIFTIVSLLMANGLKSVMNAYTRTDERARHLRDIQFFLLLFSRDIEQVVNRSVLMENGKEDVAFKGDKETVTFTHAGYVGLSINTPYRGTPYSLWQRTQYAWHDEAIWRTVWSDLDRTTETHANIRRLLTEVDSVEFRYLDQAGRFQTSWPADHTGIQVLPRAVSIQFSLKQGEVIKQLYVIPARSTQIKPPPAPSIP